MKKNKILPVTGIIIFLSLSIAIPIVLFAKEKHIYDFETDFEGWKYEAYDQLNQTASVEWSVKRTNTRAYSQNYAIQVDIDGEYEEGNVWIERQFSFDKNYSGRVDVSFYIYNEEYNSTHQARFFLSITDENPFYSWNFDDTMTPDLAPNVIIGSTSSFTGWRKVRLIYELEEVSEFWVSLGIVVLENTLLQYEIDYITIRY